MKRTAPEITWGDSTGETVVFTPEVRNSVHKWCRSHNPVCGALSEEVAYLTWRNAQKPAKARMSQNTHLAGLRKLEGAFASAGAGKTPRDTFAIQC